MGDCGCGGCWNMYIKSTDQVIKKPFLCFEFKLLWATPGYLLYSFFCVAFSVANDSSSDSWFQWWVYRHDQCGNRSSSLQLSWLCEDNDHAKHRRACCQNCCCDQTDLVWSVRALFMGEIEASSGQKKDMLWRSFCFAQTCSLSLVSYCLAKTSSARSSYLISLSLCLSVWCIQTSNPKVWSLLHHRSYQCL